MSALEITKKEEGNKPLENAVKKETPGWARKTWAISAVFFMGGSLATLLAFLFAWDEIRKWSILVLLIAFLIMRVAKAWLED